jgi:hypothetical protein
MQSGPIMVDPSLQQELKPGEQLLWWGKPDIAHRVKTRSVQTINLTISIILALVMAALVVFSIQLFREESSIGSIDSNTVILLLMSLVLLGIYIYRLYQFFSQRTHQTTNLKQTTYGITNQRVIVITATAQHFIVNSYRANDIGQINRVETGGGWGDVSYGKARHIQRGRRTITIVEKLVGIANVRLVEDLLVTTFKSDSGTAPAFSPALTPLPPQPYPPTPQFYHLPQGQPQE